MKATKVRVGMCLPTPEEPEVLEMVTRREVVDGVIRLYVDQYTYYGHQPDDEIDVRNTSGEVLS